MVHVILEAVLSVICVSFCVYFMSIKNEIKKKQALPITAGIHVCHVLP